MPLVGAWTTDYRYVIAVLKRAVHDRRSWAGLTRTVRLSCGGPSPASFLSIDRLSLLVWLPNAGMIWLPKMGWHSSRVTRFNSQDRS